MNIEKKRSLYSVFVFVGVCMFICAFLFGISNFFVTSLVCLAIAIPLSIGCFVGYVSTDEKIKSDAFIIALAKDLSEISSRCAKMSDVELKEKIESSNKPSEIENVLALVEAFNRWRNTL